MGMAYWLDGMLMVSEDRDEYEWVATRVKHKWHYGAGSVGKDEDDLIVSGDQEDDEWTMMALESFNSYYGESDDDPEYQAWLKSLPDIGESGK